LLTRAAEVQKRLAALRSANDPNLTPIIALDLTYDILSATLRPRFEALAVFPFPFTQIAAAAIWKTDAPETTTTLNELVHYNLLDYYPDSNTYTLHDLTRFYAEELLLGQHDLTRSVLARYAVYTFEEALRANQLYRKGGDDLATGLRRFAANWPHLWTAWQRMSGTTPGWLTPEGVDRWLCDFPVHLNDLLNITLPQEERLPLFEHALEAARRLKDRKAEGKHLSILGRLYSSNNDTAKALSYHEKHLQIAYELRDRYGEADALMNIGLASGALGNIDRVRESWRQSLALFDMIGDPRAEQVRAWLTALKQKTAPAEPPSS